MRVLTTHTGSLPRPPELLALLGEVDEGRVADPAALETLTAQAVRAVVRAQADAGIDVVSDGEMSKVGFVNYVKDRIDGFGGESPAFRPRDLAEYPELADARRSLRPAPVRPACTAPVRYRDRAALDRDLAHVRAALADVAVEEAFMCAPSPGCVSQVMADQHYGERSTYLYALGDALRVEYTAIAEAGLVLQVDCPDLGMGRHVEFQDSTIEEYRRIIAGNLEVLDHALAGIPTERIRVHLCWGNYIGPHHHDVALRDILDVVLRMRAGAFSIEAANPRHAHEWAVFEDVRLPDGVILIPGVIDPKTNYIEHPELIKQQLVRFAKLVGRENVMAGTDCGFGTFARSSMVLPRIAFAKLAAMAEGARLATRELWGRA